jgi:integrase
MLNTKNSTDVLKSQVLSYWTTDIDPLLIDDLLGDVKEALHERYLTDHKPLHRITADEASKLAEVKQAIRDLNHKLEGTDHAQTPSISTSELVDAFLESKRSAVTVNSLISYRGTLNPFVKHYPALPTTPQEIETYLARFKEKRSACGAYIVLKMLYAFASQRYGICNIIESVQRPRFREKEAYAFNQDEARAVLAACRDDRELGLIHLYLGHGWRLDEACRANVGDIGDGQIQVRGKVRTEYMPLLPESRDILLRLAGNRRPDEPLFTSQHGKRLCHKMTYNVVKAILNRAGVCEGKMARVATHTLRKTFASMALAGGCDGRIVARLLRHCRRDTTDLYLALPMEMLRQNLERYSPIRLLNGHSLSLPEQLPKIFNCSI